MCHVTTEIEHARRVGTELAERLEAIAPARSASDGLGQMQAEVSAALDWALQQLAHTGLTGPANQMASGAFWEAAESWLRHGELQVHARTETARVCRRLPVAGEDLRTRVLSPGDRPRHGSLFPEPGRPESRTISHPTCGVQAAGPLPGHLLGHARVACVGSGPAVELREVAQSLQCSPVSLQITLIDMDQQALDHAVAGLSAWLERCDLQPVRANLARLERAGPLQQLTGCVDYLYCPGFFDYLDDLAAQQMLCLLADWLAPGGEMTVYNFAPTNTSRGYMEWIGNWYLIYRDTLSMRQLAASLPPQFAVQIESIADAALVELTVRCAT